MTIPIYQPDGTVVMQLANMTDPTSMQTVLENAGMTTKTVMTAANVMMRTRARGLLYVVGDRAAAAESGIDYLANFADYAAESDQGSMAGIGQVFQKFQ